MHLWCPLDANLVPKLPQKVNGQDRESEHAIEREIGHSCHGTMITVSHQLMLIKHNGPSCILVV